LTGKDQQAETKDGRRSARAWGTVFTREMPVTKKLPNNLEHRTPGVAEG